MIRLILHFRGFTSTAGDSCSESLHTSLSLGMEYTIAKKDSQEALRQAWQGSQSELNLCGAALWTAQLAVQYSVDDLVVSNMRSIFHCGPLMQLAVVWIEEDLVSSAGQPPRPPWTQCSRLDLGSSSADRPQWNLARQNPFSRIAAQTLSLSNKVLSRLDKAALSESRDQHGKSGALAGGLRAQKRKGGV